MVMRKTKKYKLKNIIPPVKVKSVVKDKSKDTPQGPMVKLTEDWTYERQWKKRIRIGV